jgi:hypothetical protein
MIFAAVVGKAVYDASSGHENEFTPTPDVPLL